MFSLYYAWKLFKYSQGDFVPKIFSLRQILMLEKLELDWFYLKNHLNKSAN